MPVFVNDDGSTYSEVVAHTAPTTLTVPPDAIVLNPPVRPMGVVYQKNLYVVGSYSRPLVYTSDGLIWAIGIASPPAPTMALDSGSGGSTGELNIGYITFAHMDSFGNIMAESNPTTALGGTLTSNGTGFVWTGIPTVAANTRVNTVRGWRSVDGEVPALAWTRSLGVTTVTENVLTTDLGPDVLPVKEGLDGSAQLDVFARGVLPYVTMIESYSDCMWYAGDLDHPQRVYRSLPFEPEAVNVEEQSVANDATFFETKDGETITGLIRHQDTLLVLCPESAYAVQGFGTGDFSMIKVSNYYGCISKYSCIRASANSDVFFLGPEGATMFNGQFRHLMEDLQDYFRDAYIADTPGHELSWAIEDRYSQSVQFYIPVATTNKAFFRYILCYVPVSRGEQPWWVFDSITRGWTSAGTFSTPGELRKDLYTGSCDGYIRKENVDGDGSDDGDAGGKTLYLLHKHQFFGEQGGDDGAGKTFRNLDVFIRNDDQNATVFTYTGDDTASDAITPTWTNTIPFGMDPTKRSRVGKTAWHTILAEGGAGSGIAVGIQVVAPIRVEYRGYGLYNQPTGVQNRGFTS